MSKQPRLTSLDVRGNHNIGAEGAEALASLIESTRGVGVVARSVCGVSPSNSSLEVSARSPLIGSPAFSCHVSHPTRGLESQPPFVYSRSAGGVLSNVESSFLTS